MMVKAVKTAAVACLAMYAASSYAATQQLVGSTITYEYEDTQAALALFGSPVIVGDVVRFLPPNFRAESNAGVGVNSGTQIDVATANFIFDRVYTNDTGLAVSAILVQEFGDYEITNGDSVSGDLLLTVSSNTVNPLLNFAFSDDSVDFSGDSGGLQKWSMSALVDPEIDFLNPSNDVAVTIQNTLTATTDASGEIAWIQKKLAFVAVEEGGVLPPIPIPAAGWLFGSALLGLVGVTRRKRG